MSATAMLQLKQQLSRLSDKERQEVAAFLHRLKQDTPAWQKEMASRMTEMDGGKKPRKQFSSSRSTTTFGGILVLCLLILTGTEMRGALVRMDVQTINEASETASGVLNGVAFTFAGLNASGPGERGLVAGYSVINSTLNVFNSSAFFEPAPSQDALSIQFADNFRLSFSQPITGLYLDVSDLQHVSSLGNTLTFQDESHAALNFSLVASNGYFVPSASSLQATPSGSTLANGTIYFATPLTELYIMSDLKFSDGGYINIGVVPEPDASLGFLWLSSMLGICIFRRRR